MRAVLFADSLLNGSLAALSQMQSERQSSMLRWVAAPVSIYRARIPPAKRQEERDGDRKPNEAILKSQRTAATASTRGTCAEFTKRTQH